MESIELNELFKAYNHKIETVVSANNLVIDQIRLQKPKRTMQQVYNYRIVEVITFGLLSIFFGWYISERFSNINLLICGIIGAIFNIIALSGSISQLLLLKQIDYSEPILAIKEKIERVNSHELYIVKLLLLSAPLWWAFNAIIFDIFFEVDFIAEIDKSVKVIYLAVNVSLAIPLIYLLTQLNHKKIHKKTIRRIIHLFSNSRVLKALEQLEDIERFKK